MQLPGCMQEPHISLIRGRHGGMVLIVSLTGGKDEAQFPLLEYGVQTAKSGAIYSTACA